jgi:type I site-specific restriction-modification system R (restriction) subunit
VVRTVQRAESLVIESENWRAYRFLIQGVPVEYRDADGEVRAARAWLVDWRTRRTTTFIAVNQLSIAGPKRTLRPSCWEQHIHTAQVIAEIVEIAKTIRAERQRGEKTGLSENELGFYDALSTNESARLAMHDESLRKIAHEVIEIVRNDAKTDWQVKETVRAKLRTRIKRLLIKRGYPPDQEPTATHLIMQQAEVMVEAGDG